MMKTMPKSLLLLVTLAALLAPVSVASADETPAAAAPAAAVAPAPVAAPAPPTGENPLSTISLEKYRLNRDKGDIPVEVGRRFLADLKAVSPATWASVTDAVRFEIQNDETEKFARQKDYVLYAYGALWVILLLFVGGVFFRQRQLASELAELERRVSVERK